MVIKGNCKRRTFKELQKDAMKLRSTLASLNQPIDIIKVVERILPQEIQNFSFVILEDDEWKIDGVEAITVSQDGNICLIIPEQTYRDARIGRGRARFTIAHEIGHVVLHSAESIKLARKQINHYSGDKTYSPEWQADVFAAELLCPSTQVRNMKIMEIQQTYIVSKSLAETQKNISKYTK